MPKLKIGNFIKVPVHLELNDADAPNQTAVFDFDLTCQRLSASEWDANFGADGEKRTQKVRDFLTERIKGWRGQTLVVDDNDQPSAFSAEALDVMLGVVGVQDVIFSRYVKEASKASTPEAIAKN